MGSLITLPGHGHRMGARLHRCRHPGTLSRCPLTPLRPPSWERAPSLVLRDDRSVFGVVCRGSMLPACHPPASGPGRSWADAGDRTPALVDTENFIQHCPDLSWRPWGTPVRLSYTQETGSDRWQALPKVTKAAGGREVACSEACWALAHAGESAPPAQTVGPVEAGEISSPHKCFFF